VTFSDLASIGSFASGMAVVVTLVFLTMQLRQNTAQMMRNELNAAQEQFARFRFAIVNSRDVAEMWTAGMQDGALDAVDEQRYVNLLNDLFWSVFNVWERHSRGIATDVPGALSFLAAILVSRRSQTVWQQFRHFFPPNYVQAVEDAVVAARNGGTPAHAEFEKTA
jgi:predicted PurR-regulated permease PerM